MWKLDYKESWAPKNWCFWTVVLEKTLESSLDCKEIQSVSPKGNQSWVFIGRTDAEAETPILWPPDAKKWLIWKDSDSGKDWRQEVKERQRVRWLDGITDLWTWVWVSSRSWWWTGKPGVLQSLGSQRVRHDWATELNWIKESICRLKESPAHTSCFMRKYWGKGTIENFVLLKVYLSSIFKVKKILAWYLCKSGDEKVCNCSCVARQRCNKICSMTGHFFLGMCIPKFASVSSPFPVPLAYLGFLK